MISTKGKDFDIILVSAQYYEDHPLSGVGVIARVLDAKGYSVGIIEKPEGARDITRLGMPRLFFGVTSGSIDSMVHNYTPLKRKREEDEFNKIGVMPDRALIVYCNLIKRFCKGVPIVLGGVEASLRRFAHYDYWDNKLRRSILFDTRADILVYGNGEKQVIEIAEKLENGVELIGIEGTCIISKEKGDAELLPSFKEVSESMEKFCEMTSKFTNRKALAQEYTNNYLVQYKYPKYTTEDLDWIYSLPYSRVLHKNSHLRMARFSVVSHRGCIGKCSFCSLNLLQGDRIISRSEESILKEITGFTKHKAFKGDVHDLGGPSANMYGMDCDVDCDNECLECPNLDLSHKRLTKLLQDAMAIPGVKSVFIRSGIRYDLAINSPEYVEQIVKHHVSGTLKIAPEHFSEKVLKLMHKDNSRLDEFIEMFEKFSEGKNQSLRYYLMIGHPGDDMQEIYHLIEKIKELSNVEQFQLFTPTPMTASSSMYWTSLDPRTFDKVTVVHDYNTKKKMKRLMLKAIRESHQS